MLNDILKQEFEILKLEFIQKYDELGMRASGKFANEIRSEVLQEPNKFIARIYAPDYSYQLEFGRQSGKQPPSKIIEKWIYDKRISTNLKISTLAFLIARKIGKEGWKRKDFGGVELVSKVFTAERIQKIMDKAGERALQNFTSDVLTYLQILQK